MAEDRSTAEHTHLIELRDIYKIYRMGDVEVRANDGISFSIDSGEMVAIVGKSGSGKSTIMNIIGALDVPTEGKYYLDGADVGSMTDNELAVIRNKQIGFIFQQYNLLPKMNLLKNVELPLLYAGVNDVDRRERALASLEKVGLGDVWKKYPNQLSGGQQQRCAIGRAIVKNPNILLCDEPTGALDYNTSKEILKLIETVNQKYGNTVIMVTHNDAIKNMADRVVKLRDGQIRKNYINEEKIKAGDLDW